MQKQGITIAWPLSLAYLLLIVYASWYPFHDWHQSGASSWAFLIAPLNTYWTKFDFIANVLGYIPLGFLWSLSAMRMGKRRGMVGLAFIASVLVSFSMEFGQNFIPIRVASNIDLLLNSLGAGLGVFTAWLLERWGAISRWETFRSRWFVARSRGASWCWCCYGHSPCYFHKWHHLASGRPIQSFIKWW